MLGEGGTPLSKLQTAIREFLAREERDVDLTEYRALIDSLDGDAESPEVNLALGALKERINCRLQL